ncbi:MAG: methionyl-tRNA formyltransferase [bacterium]|nr:methionyl-tRNA formyltransferase [bacterium]
MTVGQMDSLRVVFLGTPAFALPSLYAIAQATTVVGVVTQPDRPSGRGRAQVAPPVAVAARELGLRLLQPESLKSAESLAELTALRPDLLVTVAYGRLVPGAVLALPPMGCINLHPSLLPEYRGASPIQRAIADGTASTGVTVMHLAEELDAGDIILQRRVAIGPEETAGELEARLALEGAVLLLEAVGRIARGEAQRRAQDHARTTYAGKLSKADGAIQWTRPAQVLVNLVRAMNPWPCAYTTWRGGVLKVWQARLADGQGPPGQVLEAGEAGITVAAGEGAVALVEVQPEGGRRMSAAAFARGHRMAAGDRLG